MAAGDLESVTDREGHATRFRYHPVIAHHLESIKDPLGRTPLRNEYDEDGRLRRHIDAFGKIIEYTHAIGVRQEIVKDRNDKQRVLEYDERGNVVREIDPTGQGGGAHVRRAEQPPDRDGAARAGNAEPARHRVRLRRRRQRDHGDGRGEPPDGVHVQRAEAGADRRRTRWTGYATNDYDPVTGNLLSTKDALNQVTDLHLRRARERRDADGRSSTASRT